MKTSCHTPEVVLDSVVVERVLSLLNEHMAGCESRSAALGTGAFCGPTGQRLECRREGQEKERLVARTGQYLKTKYYYSVVLQAFYPPTFLSVDQEKINFLCPMRAQRSPN